METLLNNERRRVEHIKETCQRVGLGRTTVYELTRSGQFPKPISLTPNGKRKGYLSDEIDAYLAARVAERDKAA